jgi:hypothetical protein
MIHKTKTSYLYKMRSPLMLFALLAMAIVAKGQDDLPVNDEGQLQFVPGLYLSFNDFIYNDPVDFEQVEGDLAAFFENPMNAKELIITRRDSVYHVEQSQVWGYTEGKNVFLNRSLFKGVNLNTAGVTMRVEPWVKIYTVGTLCFIYYVTTITINSGSSQPFNNTSDSKLILNTRDGSFYDGNLQELKKLISDDHELLGEFEKARGDKEVKFFTFLRKYNESHPFQFR